MPIGAFGALCLMRAPFPRNLPSGHGLTPGCIVYGFTRKQREKEVAFILRLESGALFFDEIVVHEPGLLQAAWHFTRTHVSRNPVTNAFS
eukprot:3140834-Amphidinium_carterae.1